MRKTLINTEESHQTGFEKERRIQSFLEKDGFCVRKSSIKKDGCCFHFKGITQHKQEELCSRRQSSVTMSLSATSDFISIKTKFKVNRMKSTGLGRSGSCVFQHYQVLEHSEKVGPRGASIYVYENTYIYIYMFIHMYINIICTSYYVHKRTTHLHVHSSHMRRKISKRGPGKTKERYRNSSALRFGIRIGNTSLAQTCLSQNFETATRVSNKKLK